MMYWSILLHCVFQFYDSHFTLPVLLRQYTEFTLRGSLSLLFFFWRYSPNLGLGLPPWNPPFHFGFLDLRQLVGLLGRVISSSQGTQTQQNANTHIQTLNIHNLSGIRTHDPGFRAREGSACLRQLGYRDRFISSYYLFYTACFCLDGHRQVCKVVDENCCSIVTLLQFAFFE
jgi:hypothetical protein